MEPNSRDRREEGEDLLDLKHPLLEVYGFPIDNFSEKAVQYRQNRLCPYNNKVPNCTKDKANNPLGVCSIQEGINTAIICPIRFRQDWMVTIDAASFFFPPGTKWTTLTEARLNDKNGRTAGNIDIVVVAYDDYGKITDFGALEIQAVYISGNIRRPFEAYIQDPEKMYNMDWTGKPNYPRPDYLSSSRKRLVPQLIYKGKILNAWNKKIAVALHSGFFSTLPQLPEVPPDKAEMAWLIYDLELQRESNCYNLVHSDTVYTLFQKSLDRIVTPEPGLVDDFIEVLQDKLDKKLEKMEVNDDDINRTIDRLL